jgi:hypothetical protein
MTYLAIWAANILRYDFNRILKSPKLILDKSLCRPYYVVHVIIMSSVRNFVINLIILVSTLMLQTWNEEEIKNFAAYFNKEWVEGNLRNWHEGSNEFPSTNNGLESINRQIKETHTFRNRAPLNKFLKTVEDLMSYFSECSQVNYHDNNSTNSTNYLGADTGNFFCHV